MPVKPNPNRKYEDLFIAAKKARLPFEREAWLNVAFHQNQQYVEWHTASDGDDGYLRTIPQKKGQEGRPRMVINRIMHFVRTAQADALEDRPSGDVLPPSADHSDIGDARVAKSWIEAQSDSTRLNYDAKLARATWWATLAGNGYLKWLWDGDIDQPALVAPSFFETYLDPYARMWDDVRYIFHSQYLDTEQVYDTFGTEVKPTSSANDEKTWLLRAMGAAPVLNGCVVNELWMKPNRRHKKGLYVIWSGRQTLREADDLPYPHLYDKSTPPTMRLPWTYLGMIERGDSPYCASPVTYLRPPQMELNVFHNQMIANREAFSNAKWSIPKELEMDEDPDDSPHQILRWSASAAPPGTKPELIQPIVFPAGAMGDHDILEQGMMHTIGQREVSNAQVPGRVEAAKAIELLKEADAGALAFLRSTIKNSNDQGWWHLLQEARTFQKAEDIAITYTKEGLPEVRHFKARDMAPGHRIRTTMATSLAKSRANRQDLIIRLREIGAITDPLVLADLLELPMSQTVRKDYADIILARNENLTLAEGKAIEPNSFDNHTIHIEQHNSYRKTLDYQMLSDGAKQRFEHHCQRHDALLEIMLARDAKLAMISQGAQLTQPGQQPPTTQQPTQQEEAPDASQQ